MASVTFTSKYNQGDEGFIFKEGDYSPAGITKISFREGFNPLEFNADNDFVYTTNVVSAEGPEIFIVVPQKHFFATKQEMVDYIIPPEPEP